MKLNSKIVKRQDLLQEEKDLMLSLMQRYYVNVSSEDFNKDLAQKDYVILLYNEQCKAVVFSTFFSFDFVYNKTTNRIAFSGDTIIDPDYWGSLSLPLAFGQLMRLVKKQYPQQDLYWLLISKGIRTYRFLPVFFRRYYPSCNGANAPELKGMMDELASDMFNESYDSQAGIVRAVQGSQFLKKHMTSQNYIERNDPHISFFYEKNPGHGRGDELVCLLKFEDDNLRPYIRKQLDALTQAEKQPVFS